MSLQLTILGSNSAIPVYDRFPSSQVLQVEEQLYLIDCGEGCQFQLNANKIKRSKINQIFISHLHGDHLNGLMGLLTSYSLNGRTEKMTLVGPAPIKKYVESNLEFIGTILSYPIEFIEIGAVQHEKVFQDDNVEVYSIPLDHRIATSGYLFKELPKLRNIKEEVIHEFKLSFSEINQIKQGEDIHRSDGSIIEAETCLHPAKPVYSYAYISDTAYSESIIPFIEGVDLLYHETTYLDDMRGLASERKHSTSKEAAMIAKKAGASILLTGHYSSRYKDLAPFYKEASEIFENVIIGKEGLNISIPNS